MTTIAARIFDGAEAQFELDRQLEAAGAVFERTTWDDYDNSLELKDVPPEHRLSVEAQRVIHAAGFTKVYVNHVDKWETHYGWKYGEEFAESKGWRVSYPHKRGPEEKGIWVEEFISGWPKEWFGTGYAIVKKFIGK